MQDDPRRIDVSRRGSGMLAIVALGLMAVFVLGIFIYASRPAVHPDVTAAANTAALPTTTSGQTTSGPQAPAHSAE